jgi:hypothetical protein
MGFFLAVVALIRPWADLPLNDDWQYAHLAKRLAGRGIFAVNPAYESKTLIGQAAMAWPVIRIFGFSHVALRLLTLFLSILMLVEVDYLLFRGAVPAGIRFVALCTLVANPFFLYFSTTFMTENYGYFVALLAACVWFRGRDQDDNWLGVLAAAIAGFGFWIRQFSALVFPALVLAEAMSATAQGKGFHVVVRRRLPALSVWAAISAGYFLWAKATGNYVPQLTSRLERILTPSPLILFVELGVLLFYLTLFFTPFLITSIRWKPPSIMALLIAAVLTLTAGAAWAYGDRTGLPRANLRFAFLFLQNVLTSYGVGPITLTGVYIGNSQTRPRVSDIPWLALEIIAIPVSVAWGEVFARVRAQKNEVGVFGICFALISFTAVALYFQNRIIDRYHYPAILGVTLAAPVFFQQVNVRRLRFWALPWVGATAVFSTLALHDYFRWNEVRAQLLADAQGFGIEASQVDAGHELNAWNSVEGVGPSLGCDWRVNWFCWGRPYRIGLQRAPAERLIMSRRVNAWFVSFPDLKLLARH